MFRFLLLILLISSPLFDRRCAFFGKTPLPLAQRATPERISVSGRNGQEKLSARPENFVGSGDTRLMYRALRRLRKIFAFPLDSRAMNAPSTSCHKAVWASAISPRSRKDAKQNPKRRFHNGKIGNRWSTGVDQIIEKQSVATLCQRPCNGFGGGRIGKTPSVDRFGRWTVYCDYGYYSPIGNVRTNKLWKRSVGVFSELSERDCDYGWNRTKFAQRYSSQI